MQKITITIIAAVIIQHSFAQKRIAKCWLWKPKDGQEQKFEEGYHNHYLWHKQNGDTTSWYCWQYVSGPNYGRFLDVSFNLWKDLDVSFKPDEDDADYQLHVKPYADLQNTFKLAYQENLSSGDSIGLRSKYIRFVTITVSDVPGSLKLLEELKNKYVQNGVTKNFFVYKLIDGGNMNQFLLMMGFKNYMEFGKSENLQDEVSEIESSLKIKTIMAISSETLTYRSDLFVINK